jgi:hypothetical protein
MIGFGAEYYGLKKGGEGNRIGNPVNEELKALAEASAAAAPFAPIAYRSYGSHMTYKSL